MGATRSGRFTVTALEGLLVAAMLLVAVFGVFLPALGPAGVGFGRGPMFGAVPTVEVTLDPGAVTIDTDPQLPGLAERTIEAGDGIELLIPTGTRAVVYDPDLRQRLALVATPVFGGLLSIAVLALLLRITCTLRQGDLFVAINARRLYLIAILVGIGGQATVLLTSWGRLGVLRHPDVAPVLTDVSTTIVPLFAGLGIAVAAEVFRQGTRMRAELEGLV